MENSYGIGVRNRYALFLDDESDPLEVLKETEKQKADKKKTKVAEKENKGKPDPVPKVKTAAPPKKPVKEIAVQKPQDKREGKCAFGSHIIFRSRLVAHGVLSARAPLDVISPRSILVSKS